MAYVLGFFFADGSHDINPRGSEYFSFQITDRKLLYAMRRALELNHKIAVRTPRKISESTQYRLQIGSKDMCQDLRTFGVVSMKSSTMKLPAIPEKCINHFVRGYFDGDGNVWTGDIHKERKTQHTVLQTGFTSASGHFLRDLHSMLLCRGISGGSIYCKKSAFCIKYSTFDSIKLYDVMYSQLGESKLYLPRKRRVFENFIKVRGGSSTG